MLCLLCFVFCVVCCVLCVTASRSAPASQFLPVCVASLLPPLLPSQWLHRLQAGAPILPGIYLWISCLPPLPPPSSPPPPRSDDEPKQAFPCILYHRQGAGGVSELKCGVKDLWVETGRSCWRSLCSDEQSVDFFWGVVL